MQKILFCLLMCALCLSCTKDKTEQAPPDLNLTYKGVSVSATDAPPHAYDMSSVQNISANAVTIVPTGIVYPGADTILFDKVGMEWGQMTAGVIEQINTAKSLDLKVMIKPEVQFVDGTATNDFEAVDDSSWTKFENSYWDFVTHFMNIADSLDCELFCIGTELGKFTVERTSFWTDLVSNAESNFSGKLTYASHWEDYSSIPFWGELDYIGIDAYFSVDNTQTPDVYAIKDVWVSEILPGLQKMNEQYDKSVIFTEFGYRSIDYAANEPWDSELSGTFNEQAQANCYLGMFNSFEGNDWIEGGFLWQWYIGNTTPGGNDDLGYTPQNKAAEQVIGSIYGSIE